MVSVICSTVVVKEVVLTSVSLKAPSQPRSVPLVRSLAFVFLATEPSAALHRISSIPGAGR